MSYLQRNQISQPSGQSVASFLMKDSKFTNSFPACLYIFFSSAPTFSLFIVLLLPHVGILTFLFSRYEMCFQFDQLLLFAYMLFSIVTIFLMLWPPSDRAGAQSFISFSLFAFPPHIFIKTKWWVLQVDIQNPSPHASFLYSPNR